MSLNFTNYIKLILAKFSNMPLDQFFRKVYRKIKSNISIRVFHIKLLFTDLREDCESNSSLSFGRFDFNGVKCTKESIDKLEFLANNWNDGIYDILGSGPISILKEIDKEFIDILKPVHMKACTRISALISCNYKYKRWNVDFKSGKEWSFKEPSFKCKYGDFEGVDIKVPWELSRLQHLTQLALLSREVEIDIGTQLAQEVIDQILDFWAFNPVYMGPNWICAMDVAIRAVNILVSIDLIYKDYSHLITEDIERELGKLIFQHGSFIVDNSEYSAELTSNHYVANVVGLLFISFYLEGNELIDCWFSFSIQELFNEIEKQYCTDGGNFERTTSYHRLSSEMFLWALSLIKGLTETELNRLKSCRSLKFSSYPRLKALTEQDYTIEKYGIDIPDRVKLKVYHAMQFSIDMMKPTGEVCQFGDNDSGRFIKLTPVGDLIDYDKAIEKYLNLHPNKMIRSKYYWDEACLNHSAYINLGAALFDIKLPGKVLCCEIEQEIIRSISRRNVIDIRALTIGDENVVAHFQAKKLFDDNKLIKSKVIVIKREDGIDFTNGMTMSEYSDTGVIVFQSRSMYFAVSNMPNGALGSGAHSHNDQMSIELQVKGEDICRDPGAYLYTSSPECRNEFRGVAAHNVMRPFLTETNRFFGSANALFAKENESRTAIFDITDTGCSMQIYFYGIKQQRVITINKDTITIVDKSDFDFDNELNKFKYFSKGFGFLEVSEHINKSVNIEYINE